MKKTKTGSILSSIKLNFVVCGENGEKKTFRNVKQFNEHWYVFTNILYDIFWRT